MSIWIMKRTSLMFSVILCSCSSFGELGDNHGYLVFDVKKSIPADPELYWLGLCAGDEIIHLRSDQLIHKLKSGKYYLTHLDASTDFCETYDDLRLEKKDFVKIEIVAGKLNYFGRVEIRAASIDLGVKQIAFTGGPEIMEEVCIDYPEIVSGYPFKVVNGSREWQGEYKFICDRS